MCHTSHHCMSYTPITYGSIHTKSLQEEEELQEESFIECKFVTRSRAPLKGGGCGIGERRRKRETEIEEREGKESSGLVVWAGEPCGRWARAHTHTRLIHKTNTQTHTP